MMKLYLVVELEDPKEKQMISAGSAEVAALATGFVGNVDVYECGPVESLTIELEPVIIRRSPAPSARQPPPLPPPRLTRPDRPSNTGSSLKPTVELPDLRTEALKGENK